MKLMSVINTMIQAYQDKIDNEPVDELQFKAMELLIRKHAEIAEEDDYRGLEEDIKGSLLAARSRVKTYEDKISALKSLRARIDNNPDVAKKIEGEFHAFYTV